MRAKCSVALRKLGYSGNTTDPKEIEAAYNELKKLMPNVAAFNSDNPANPYMEGEVNLGMVWNGSAFVARQAGTPLEVVWPKEGGIFWMDSLAIPANAKNVEGALKLINFLLRPDVAKEVAETIGYPTPNPPRGSCSALKWQMINRFIRTLKPSAKGNGRTTSVTRAACMKSIIRS